MADTKISDLPAVTDVQDTDEFVLARSGVTNKIDGVDLRSELGLFNAYALLRDEQAANTNGGGFTSGAWQTRPLNTEVSDVAGIVSLSANQFTLQAGTYRIYATAPGYACARHKTKLLNVTDTSDALIGSSEYCHVANGGSNRSVVSGTITIAGAKTFSVQHRCETTRGTDGMGVASNFALTEVYAIVEIWRFA